jgi:hypothetical protein
LPTFANCLPIACIIRCYSRSIFMPVWFSRGHGRDIQAMACCFACGTTMYCMPISCTHDYPPRAARIYTCDTTMHCMPMRYTHDYFPRAWLAYVYVTARCIVWPRIMQQAVRHKASTHTSIIPLPYSARASRVCHAKCVAMACRFVCQIRVGNTWRYS